MHIVRMNTYTNKSATSRPGAGLCKCRAGRRLRAAAPGQQPLRSRPGGRERGLRRQCTKGPRPGLWPLRVLLGAAPRSGAAGTPFLTAGGRLAASWASWLCLPVSLKVAAASPQSNWARRGCRLPAPDPLGCGKTVWTPGPPPSRPSDRRCQWAVAASQLGLVPGPGGVQGPSQAQPQPGPTCRNVLQLPSQGAGPAQEFAFAGLWAASTPG